ncbi:lipase [Rhodococcoides trifolii]|uniref:Lipase n=1 Tax=Rhodococcoides trifolii TaxID=908250 RepID=A0A917G011_9NOCA|nr:SGNH/GDSL hydrolase family protein [Rhodococcus trifolii]GGG16095.1 lipase [Rhodococcus trifolii]
MTDVQLFPSTVVRIDGARDVGPSEHGGVYARRLPVWTRAQYPDVMTDFVMSASGGIRLAFRTTSTTLALQLHTTVLEMRGETSQLTTQVVDVVVDGVHVRRCPVGIDAAIVVAEDGSIGAREGGPTTTVVDHLGDGDKQVELWLPNGTATAVLSLSADGEIRPPTPETRPRWIHYGSSLSQGLEAAGIVSTWPVRVALSRGLAIYDLSFTGNAMLDPFVARSIAAAPADLITLELGANIHNGASMTARTFGPAVDGFLDTVRDGHPTTPITLVSPTPFPVAEDRPGPVVRGDDGNYVVTSDEAAVLFGALTVQNIRDTLRDIVDRRSRDDHHLQYIDGRDLLHADEAPYLVDGLHPGDAGHEVMAARFDALWTRNGDWETATSPSP